NSNIIFNISYLTNLKHLKAYYLRIDVDKLPLNLMTLEMSSYDNNDPIINLPPKLESIVIDGFFNKKILFHDSIKSITIGRSFNQKIKKFPSNLEHLML